jgi:hypothetical protein
MSAASIEIQGVPASCRPGETVSGSVRWSANAAPRAIEIRLFWMTSGVAPRQIGLIQTRAIARPDPSASSRFEFVLPDGPWSFEGALTRLDWVIEAVMVVPGCSTRVMFSLGPDGWRSDFYPRPEPSEQET